MTRVPLRSDEELDDTTRAHIEALIGQVPGASVPDLWRLLANAPDLLKAWTELAWALRNGHHADFRLRQLIIMRTAQLSQANYPWAHHWKVAIAAGVSEQQLMALSRWSNSDLFSESERAALSLTDELVLNGRVTDPVFDAISSTSDAPAVIHLVLSITFYVCVARFTSALELGIEPRYADTPSLTQA